MLYVIIGGNAADRAQKRRSLVRGTAEELRLSDISLEELAAVAGTMTLTGETKEFLLQEALRAETAEEEDARDSLLDLLPGLASSAHIFILEEEKLTAKLIERIKKGGASVEVLEKKEKKAEFNVFAVADALAKGDRKNLWLLLMKAERQGTAPENIAGILAWKARTALAAARSKEERHRFERISHDLVCMYHDAHRGKGDLGLLLERFALTLS